ncbi:DUF2768 domain-containing protein [Caldibacillus thermolactis]|jgi:hypothetical protein|uniref:DUF2768 domain-containing protein n=1 Tax=Pallidibacillus thermolactis TaxID=251051 RepID=A0ABT2WDG7_9BACI|nr:DUF2768 domain-containing protein [Pallidibacillus thermolactis]MCU9593708.1 DUF2768 domain-containing protein [Pallidibacillus thermolactis]MCU9599792.1 DUF2768 domain-containing protein [Pallidibacillus thermolactis subsp. kokeshiiformis]MED1673819.1 DUF2768 domain-containing protein [Pallidibacillus thermolactis subsp. kokeshiiformis]
MSPAMMKMWVSFLAMGMMFLSAVFIYLSRYKFKKKLFRVITAFVAYGLMIYAGIIMILIVFSGPTPD